MPADAGQAITNTGTTHAPQRTGYPSSSTRHCRADLAAAQIGATTVTAMPEASSSPLPHEGTEIATYDARELVANGVQACIVLDGVTYFLRITRAGKLILTK